MSIPSLDLLAHWARTAEAVRLAQRDLDRARKAFMSAPARVVDAEAHSFAADAYAHANVEMLIALTIHFDTSEVVRHLLLSREVA